MEPLARNRSQSVASTSPELLEPTIHRPRQRGKTSQKYLKPIFGEDVEEESRSSTRPSRTVYPQSKLRGFSTQRAAQLVRFIYIDKSAQHVTLYCFRPLSGNQ
jgi:hypothetical protein